MQNIFKDLKRKDHKRYLGVKFCRRLRIRIFIAVGGYSVYYHANRTSAQCGAFGNCNRALFV